MTAIPEATVHAKDELHVDLDPRESAWSWPAALGRTGAFSLLFLGAALLGRLTVLDGKSLSLVWPAAGVSVLWFLVQGAGGRSPAWGSRVQTDGIRSPRPPSTFWLDVAALAVVTFSVNVATGAPMRLAVAFIAANLAQVFVFGLVFGRLCPDSWPLGPGEPLCRAAQLWRFTLAAGAGTGVGTALGPTAVWASTGVWSWQAIAIWFVRNLVSIVVIGVVGLRLAWLFRTRRAPRRWQRMLMPPAQIGPMSPYSWTCRTAELVGVLGVSAAAYVLIFIFGNGLPLAFPLLTPTVWIALRFSTNVVALHTLAGGGAAVLFTLHGDGPFAGIGSPTGTALVVQAFVGILAIVAFSLSLSRDERDVLLIEVRRQEIAARRQAQLMTTLIESMTEGVTVINSDNEFILSNPAAGRLLSGAPRAMDGPVSSNERYGVFHLDGRPLGDDEALHVRALRGEEVRDVDILVRNAGVPEGRLLNVDALPLPEIFGGSAMAIFRDVTEERRHRDELTAFAGVVAHDLLNPLTVIEGWVEVLLEVVEGTEAAQPLAAEALQRIARSSARMRNLIQDLLHYTTARDAILAPVSVDLNVLLDEIVAERATLPGLHPDTPAPRFVVERLPVVQADPALLRQLLDNLVSNAIKYTAAGVAPEVTVAAAELPGEILVEVSDRGIGIPAGQHAAIFDNFHRAHADQAYTGTGLGLGICKRIVERHGGTLAVTDQPEGGSKFSFTLPQQHSR